MQASLLVPDLHGPSHPLLSEETLRNRAWHTHAHQFQPKPEGFVVQQKECVGPLCSFLHRNYPQRRICTLVRIGYLTCNLFLHKDHELMLLLINTMQRDLQSANHIEARPPNRIKNHIDVALCSLWFSRCVLPLRPFVDLPRWHA